MIDTKKVEEIVQGLSNALPPGVSQMREDVETNLRSALSSALGKLNLVTREEYDVQLQVLQRTREKLEALEKRVAELEQRNL